MARIPEEVINQIRNKADIVEVISSYIPLTKKGRNYMGVCPFHDDHNPSMSVSSEKQIYHCFVCGAGGNVFQFVQDYEKISFVEAVKKVAEMIHYDLDDSYTGDNGVHIDPKTQRIYDLLNEAINYTNYELGSVVATETLEYLHNRGISDEIIAKYQLGYNPKEDVLTKFLKSKGFSDEEIISAGVGKMSDQGLRDVFFNRIMIPIHDNYGHPVGFSARRCDENDSAKYINTAETKIYVKGNLIYNYHRAKEAIRKSGKVIVCEGAMDVIALEKVGITNVVATLGTACTKNQIRLLKFLHATIVLFYDGDEAGQMATYKFAEQAISNNLAIEIVLNNEGLDPDEIIEKDGKQALIDMINKTISYIDFLFFFLSKRFNLENYSEKRKFSEIIASAISRLDKGFEKQTYFNKLKQLTGFDFENEDFKVKKETNQYYANNHKRISKPLPGLVAKQMQIISLMLLDKDSVDIYKELGFLPDNNYHQLATDIIDYYRKYDTMDVAGLFDVVKDKKVQKILSSITSWKARPDVYSETLMKEAVLLMKIEICSEKIKVLRENRESNSSVEEKLQINEEIKNCNAQIDLLKKEVEEL